MKKAVSDQRSAISRDRLVRSLYRIARTRVGRVVVGWAFAYMSFLIPFARLRETDALIAFHHPQPSHAFHVLLVPKKALHTDP